MDGRQPPIHEAWTFGEDGVTCEVHTTVQVDIVAGLVGEFVTEYLTESWCRNPLFGRNYINGSVYWLAVPDLHRTNVTAWTANHLSPRPSWGDRGSTTNPNWVSQFGVDSGSVSVPWNFHVRVLPVYHRRIS